MENDFIKIYFRLIITTLFVASASHAQETKNDPQLMALICEPLVQILQQDLNALRAEKIELHNQNRGLNENSSASVEATCDQAELDSLKLSLRMHGDGAKRRVERNRRLAEDLSRTELELRAERLLNDKLTSDLKAAKTDLEAEKQRNAELKWQIEILNDSLKAHAEAKQVALKKDQQTKAKKQASEVKAETKHQALVTFDKLHFLKLTKLQRLQLQYGLKKLGYYKASLDGLWGNQTHQAVNKFAKDTGLRGWFPMSALNALKVKVDIPDNLKPTARKAQPKSASSSSAKSSNGSLGVVVGGALLCAMTSNPDACLAGFSDTVSGNKSNSSNNVTNRNSSRYEYVEIDGETKYCYRIRANEYDCD